MGDLFDGRQGAISTRMSRHSESARTWASALQEHERICQALESRDPQEATAAMLSHLKASRTRWIGES